MNKKNKWNVLKRGLTSGAAYDASVQDYYENLQRQYEEAKRKLAEYEEQKREYEKLRKDAEERKAKAERERKLHLEKLNEQTSVEEREKAAVRALEKWGNGETPDLRDADLFEISDYKKSLPHGNSEKEWYEKAWRKIKDFFLSADGITATGWKMNDIQASQFSGNLVKSREDQQLLNMAEDYYKGNRTQLNLEAIQELNRRKPDILNKAAVYANKALDWLGNNSITGTTGAFLGTDELDKVRIDIGFDENTNSLEALLNITKLRNSYKALDEESYNAYLENHNKAKYYENLLSNDAKRKINVAEGSLPSEQGVTDGSVEFFNWSKLKYQLPGIIAGSISSPSQMASSFATGIWTAGRILATTAAAIAATVGTGGWGAVAVPAIMSAVGAAVTFGLNQASGSHENSAEVDEGYISKVKYALDRHPGVAADFYKRGRSVLGEHATEEEIITAKLANKIPSVNSAVDKAFNDAAIGSQRQFDRDMVATTLDSTIDTAIEITPLKFFTTLSKSAVKANLRSSRIARAANKIAEKASKVGSKIEGGDGGVLRRTFTEYGSLVSGKAAVLGGGAGAILDNTVGRIPGIKNAIKAAGEFDIAKIKRFGPKTSNWLSYGRDVTKRGVKSSISEGVEEGKQYYNQQRAVQEFKEGLMNGNLSYETQSYIGDILDDFQAGDFAASGLVQAVTGIPLLDYLHYTDTNIIEAAEAIKNIKSGMLGGHALTTLMTGITGLKQTVGTQKAIDDFELAMVALEQNKMAAQKQFAVDLILSRSNRKYIDQAVEYLKNSNSIKLSEKELEDLQNRAVEVSGVSKSPFVKALAKEQGIAKEDYDKFVADYMYHKDNLDTERENLNDSSVQLNAKANEIRNESAKIENPSDSIFEEWLKNDTDNRKAQFESNKSAQIKRLQDHLKTLNDKLEKNPLTNSQKAEVELQIKAAEESLKKVEESKFDDSEKMSYAQARFDRINTLARIVGGVNQISSLNAILSAIGEENESGRKFVQEEINAAKKLLNSWLTGNILNGKQLTADNVSEINDWISIIKRNIERADKDNPYLQGASAELTDQINSLAQAYQEHSKAVLNYNIAANLFNDFTGYNINEKGDVVPEGTKGSKRVKGNAKEHLEGIIAAQDDDAKLELAFQQGFADYGFAGVYKNESPLVQQEEQEEEESKPGTIERRNRIKQLGNKIGNFVSRAKEYVSGKWESFGHKKVFVPDGPANLTSLDPSENQLDERDLYDKLIEDYEAADDVEKWLNAPAVTQLEDDSIKSNAHLLVVTYANNFLDLDNVDLACGEMDDWSVDVKYKGIVIGTITPVVRGNKAEGSPANSVVCEPSGFDASRLNDVKYLESLIKPSSEPETKVIGGVIRTVAEDGKIKLSLPSHTDENPRQIVLEPQGDNKFYIHLRFWDGEKVPAKITNEDKKRLFLALYDELPEGAEILFPKSGPGYYGTRGTVAALQRLSRDPRFTPGTKGVLYYEDKDGAIKTYEGTSFIKKHITQSPIETSEAQDVKIQVLNDLAEKMNNKFDVTLRTSSHYFEWIGTGENRKLKLWHRLHDEIGSNFKLGSENKKNWTNRIKELYEVVYHKGYTEENKNGTKDIKNLLDYLQNYYRNNTSISEERLDAIHGYILYLQQEGDNISDFDLYECIKGIAEELSGEVRNGNGNLSLDRGSAMDMICRVVFGNNFRTPEEAIKNCESLKITNLSGVDVLIKDYFVEGAFEEAIKHIWNTRKVYVEELGYVLYTAPFTIYTEDFKNRNGNSINIAGEVDMIAIDKDGRPIIIDYKTSASAFFDKNGKLSLSFTDIGKGKVRSPQELYTNQQSAYIQMLNETTRKETTFTGGFECNEARILPIHLIQNLRYADKLNGIEVEFSKDQPLVLKTVPFTELGEKEHLIMDTEEYREKLALLSNLYAKVHYLAEHLNFYYDYNKDSIGVKEIRNILDSLDSIQLSLQEITGTDIKLYEDLLNNHISYMWAKYFENQSSIDSVCKRYKSGELELTEADKASDFNNINWKNPINDNDIEKLGGFEAMGVKDRDEYDLKKEELAHVSCNKDFLLNSTAKLTAIPYKTRRNTDKIAVYATITYNGTTYPPIRLYLSKKNGDQFAKDVLDGNTVGANIRTTIGLMSECSDGKQHLIGESEQLIEAIGGTKEDPYGNFMVDQSNNMSIAVVTYNKTSGVLSTISTNPNTETQISLPKTLTKDSANGHIVINVIPKNSLTEAPIPIICNTPQINESLGKDKPNHRNQSLLEYLTEVILPLINEIEGGNVLSEKVKNEDGTEIPLTYKQLLGFFFERYDPLNGDLVERPQYQLIPPRQALGETSWSIKIGNFKKGAGGTKTVNLDDTEALKDAIRPLSIWISTEMASVKWNSSKKGSKLFNEFAKFLSKLDDGEKFYLGDTGIYFDKTDADGTFLGFLAKNGLLTTPFNGFSHPLISINTCQKEEDDPITPSVGDGEGSVGESTHKTLEPEIVDTDDEAALERLEKGHSRYDDEEDNPAAFVTKIQKTQSTLDKSAARLYVEKVLGESFANTKLLFVDEICSLTVAGLSSGAFIAGQVSTNLMRLSRYAQNGTEYHESFHWAFELIMDPRDSDKIRTIVRKKYGITDYREITEWLADTYMQYIQKIYTPRGNLLQKAFDKINLWAITFAHVFKGEYQLYRLFNDLHSGRFVNKPINNEAVLRFLEKLKYVNQTVLVKGYEKDGVEYKYQQGPIDHYENIKEIASFALNKSAFSPALNYVTNRSIEINVKDVLDSNDAREAMMLDYNDVDGKHVPGITSELLLRFRQDPKKKKFHRDIDAALALRELLDDDHIEKTQEYISAYIDELIGVKGRDLTIDTEDDGSEEKAMVPEYAKVEDGDTSSFAGSPKEHIIPDHQISRISKTSSRIKLFFGTILIRSKIRRFAKDKKGNTFTYYKVGTNNNGRYGYYDLKSIYQYVQNRYHYVLSIDALYNAIEKDAQSNPMVYSLWRLMSKIKKLASQGNNNAIGLLNEIYKSIKSTKQTHEVNKTRREPGKRWVTYRSENIILLNNSYAISRLFRDDVLGGFNRFYKAFTLKDEDKNDILCLQVNPKIDSELSDKPFDSTYRDRAFLDFFGRDYKKGKVVEIIDKETNERRSVNLQKPIFSIYNVITSYGTRDAFPLYVQKDVQKGHDYIELPIEQNMPHVILKLTEALASIGMNVTTDQIVDILETQYGGTGVLEMQKFLSEQFTLPARGNTHKEGAKVTLFTAVTNLFNDIKNEEAVSGGILRPRKELHGTQVRIVDGRSVFLNSQAYVVMSTLIAKAQYEKYAVVGRGVDGKANYAMADDNTVTAMCDAIFDKTGDTLCTKIRQMIMDDPFNMSDKTALFRGIPIGSFILPRINRDGVHYEIVNDAGIETGNKENSSTDSDKRGADTIMSIITKLCLNMIVLAPFADKSTALSVRLHGITLPGIDYDRVNFSFRETGKEDVLVPNFRNYIQAIIVDDTGRVIIGDKNNFNPDEDNPTIDETIALYVLAEYYQAKKAILDYKDILRNHAVEGSKTDVEEEYKTAFNICKKLMFMSQFSGDYVQNEKTGEWTFEPFGIKDGSKVTDIEAADKMISQFEEIVNDRNSLLQFVNRHINGMMQHELKKLVENGIIRKVPIDDKGNFLYANELLDNLIIKCIRSAIFGREQMNSDKPADFPLYNSQAIRIFMYDIVAKSIISKQESERLFTGQSDLYNVVRDAETRIITVPYQDQAKRIGSYASTGSVGVIQDEDYICAEIPDDQQPIRDQVVRSVYMNEIAGYIKTGELNMKLHSDIDLRVATSELLRELIPEGFRPIVDRKVEHVMRGFVTTKKDGSESKNNVTDGASFISAEFTEKLLRSQGAWNNKIAKAFKRLNSDKPQDIELILNDWEVFNEVFTQVIGTLKYTAVGFRTENVNGLNKTILYVNKTALFPIFACMCNEKMDAIRRQMKDQKVDMLMFESAVKVGAHGNSNFTVDDRGNVTGQFKTYSQKSFFLRKQLNTDPNEKETMKIGIQTVKVALSAAIGETEMEWRGETVDGDIIIDEIMNDIKELAAVRKKNLMSKLDTTEDVVNYVIKFLRGNNVPEATIEAFLNNIPAEALGIQKHLDTLSVKRIQEDVVRIDSPGSAFIQRSVYGVEGPNVKFGSLELNDGEELKVVNADGSMDCVLSIDYFIEYRNGIPYFKLVPKGLKKIKLTVYDASLGKERPMSFEEIRAWLKKTNIIGKNSKASILSYRIPTQALASINALKCVDVIPVVRDTVVLPKLFTTITGSDFDIDKLFMSTVWYSMEKLEDGTYAPRQMDDESTEEGMANKVVNDYIEVLCSAAKKHPEIFYRSIDQDTKLADDVIAWINSLYPPTDEDKLVNASGILQATPSSQAKVHDEFLAGKLGIGPFALALVNHVLTRIYKISFNDKGIYLKHKSLSRDIDDDGNSIMGWLSAMINKHVDVAKNPDITKLNVNNSTFNVVALLLRLGYGKRTFAFTCQQIMRDYAFAINLQSAVCKYTKNDNGYTNPRQDAYNEIVKKYGLKAEADKLSKCNIYDILAAACREIFDKNYDGKSLCAYVLEHHGKVPTGIEIRVGNSTFELTDKLFLFMNLQLFNYLEDTMAKPLTALQQATVIDNERCITSMLQSAFYKQAVDKVKLDDTFRNVDKLFRNSYIDTKINATLEPIETILDECSSIDQDVMVAVAKAIDPNILSYGKKRMNAFLGTVRDGMVAYYGAKFFDQYCKDNNIDIKQLFKAAHTDASGKFNRGDKGITRRLAEIQKSANSNRGKYKNLRNNLLIEGLCIEGIIGEQYLFTDKQFYNEHRFMNYGFLRFKYEGQSDDNILADVQLAWDLLLNYPDEDIRNFARDLIVYAFYTSGEMSGNTKLFKYVPPSWRVSSGYGDYFNKQVKLNKLNQFMDLDDIVDKLCRNLWYKEKFVKTIGLSTMLRFLGSDILKEHKRRSYNDYGGIGETEVTEERDPIFSPVIAGIQYFDDGTARAIFDGDKDNCPRYIKCVDNHHDMLTNNDDSAAAWTLYKLVGFNTYIDKNNKKYPYPVYVQTSVLGERYYRNNIFEYNELIEVNENLDFYDILLEFLDKLGKHSAKQRDVATALQNVIRLLNVVDVGTEGAIGGEEYVTETANQLMHILVDIDAEKGTTTFQPIKPVDEFLENRRSVIEKQVKDTCNRP